MGGNVIWDSTVGQGFKCQKSDKGKSHWKKIIAQNLIIAQTLNAVMQIGKITAVQGGLKCKSCGINFIVTRNLQGSFQDTQATTGGTLGPVQPVWGPFPHMRDFLREFSCGFRKPQMFLEKTKIEKQKKYLACSYQWP